jgi:hypothetical protein
MVKINPKSPDDAFNALDDPFERVSIRCGTGRRLDRSSHMFHLCSHGSRDARRGAGPGLEGAYALRWRLPGEHQVHPALRVSQAT